MVAVMVPMVVEGRGERRGGQGTSARYSVSVFSKYL